MKTVNGVAASFIATFVTAFLAQAVGQQQRSTQGMGRETLTVCELLANTQNYAGQTVTLNATFVANFEFSALTDASCPTKVDGKHPLIQPRFDTSRYDPR